MVRHLLFLGLFLTSLLYAFLRGGVPERLTAGIFALGLAATMTLSGAFVLRFGSIEIGIFLSDSAMLILLVWIALYAERFWPIWMSAMQVIQVLSHLPILLVPEILPEAYGAVVAIWSYPMLILLIMATWRHQNRLKTLGTDRSWSDFSLQ
jgi:hypothetical protein